MEDSLWRPPPLVDVVDQNAQWTRIRLVPGQLTESRQIDGRSSEPRRPRVAALDGLRAFAIVVVLLYHADFSWAQGGFLGVDVFFVLSGFLITGLLVGEHTRTGRVRLRRFYLHRARRLLPALYTVLASVCLYVILVLPQEAAAFRGDAAAALGYATNWWLIGQGQSYFGGTGRPSLLINLWSLAVEEQFYLVWPLILCVLLNVRAAGRRGSRATSLWPALVATVVFAAASVTVMKMLYSPWTDPSRVYYGSDTRAFELFIGAGLALVSAMVVSGRKDRGQSPSTPAWRVAMRDVLGICALAALGYAVVAVPATTTWLFPVGLLVVCGAAVLVIRAAMSTGVLAKILGTRPLVWLGERSYSLYLWHWPVFDVTRPGADLSLPVAEDFALRIAVSLLLAHLTFQFIERPIRRGALGRGITKCKAALRARHLALPAFVAVLTMSFLIGAGGLGYALTGAAQRNPENPNAIAEGPGPAIALAVPSSASTPGPTVTPSTNPIAPAAASTAIPTAMPAPPTHPPVVAFVGDSQGMTLLLNKPSNTGEYLDTVDDTTEGCGFLGGDITSRDGERRDLDDGCGGAVASWASKVAAQHPDIVILMIGGWDEFNDQVNGTTLTFGTPAWDAYYNSRLAAAVTGLRATGVPRVEIALLPCYRPIPEPGSGYWPERGDDWRTRHVNALLTAYVQAQAGNGPGALLTLQPPGAFCTDPAIASDLDYRWDGLHYYKPGSALYFQTAIPQLLEPLG